MPTSAPFSGGSRRGQGVQTQTSPTDVIDTNDGAPDRVEHDVARLGTAQGFS
ncbi:hypothetical protein H9P43_009532 [Blastocladiella emersonii ATCC 22665]|nr:hypothetical protein H9P43_009532 [Blastocladiella emersonii ATCC 22665]